MVGNADVDANAGRVGSGNFRMMGHLGKARRTLVQLAHSYVGMRVDASTGDHLYVVGDIGIGMASDCDCRKHRTRVRGAHMAVVDSP